MSWRTGSEWVLRNWSHVGNRADAGTASGLPQLLPTERPCCPTCRIRMDLQRIDPGIRGFENRVFECGKCYTMKAVPAAIDRMKSPSAKWPKVRCSRP
jgi:hypothetical protein